MTSDEISTLIGQGQSEKVAFADESVSISAMTETLAAFANAEGGTLLIGIDPKGNSILGVLNVEKLIESALEAGLRCDPPLVLPRPRSVELENKQLLTVLVPAGLAHVYAVRGKYLVRSGKNNIALGPRQLRQLLRERGDAAFESMPAPGATLEDLDDQLVLSYASLFLPAGESGNRATAIDLLLRRGCLVKNNDQYAPTIAGLLLFGRDPQVAFPSAEILLVRYAGKAMSDEFLHEIARGPLQDQVRRAERFVASNMRQGARIDSVRRTDTTEYPLPAIREAIVNAVAHRDYAIRGEEIRVLMFSDRIEVYSPGRLPGHVTLENLVQERFSRNQVIAQVLADLGFVERLGYGIDRMIRLMKEWDLAQPRFAETANGFRVTLVGPDEKWKNETGDGQRWQALEINGRQRSALEFVSRNAQITNRNYRELFPDVSDETIRRDLADLVDQGLLLRMGNKRGTFYILKE